ncbi:hypothetical protein Tco_0760664 [Tanacetum coccineum]
MKPDNAASNSCSSISSIVSLEIRLAQLARNTLSALLVCYIIIFSLGLRFVPGCLKSLKVVCWIMFLLILIRLRVTGFGDIFAFVSVDAPWSCGRWMLYLFSEVSGVLDSLII